MLVVGPDDCEPAYIVRENKCGLVVPPGDAEALVQALRQLRNEPGLLEELGAASRKALDRFYDRKIVAKKWIEMLNGIQPTIR